MYISVSATDFLKGQPSKLEIRPVNRVFLILRCVYVGEVKALKLRSLDAVTTNFRVLRRLHEPIIILLLL